MHHHAYTSALIICDIPTLKTPYNFIHSRAEAVLNIENNYHLKSWLRAPRHIMNQY